MKLTSGKHCFGDGVDPSDTYAQLMIGTDGVQPETVRSFFFF
jgi:hypothetical protein